MSPAEPIDVMLLVTQEREALHIPYFVGGSVAAIVHGEYRATRDVDIVADVRGEHVGTLVAAWAGAFYVQAAEMHEAIQNAVRYRDDAQHRATFNLIHFDTSFKIDIVVYNGRPFEEIQLARRQAEVVATEPERTEYIASAEDTVLAKLEWYRLGDEVSDQQWRDIGAVLKVQATAVDRGYLSAWAHLLGIADLLDRALADAGLA
jgi:hypothetical protein